MNRLFLIGMFVFNILIIHAQNDSIDISSTKSKKPVGHFTMQVELNNRMIWRGNNYTETPIIQPYIAYKVGNLKLYSVSVCSMGKNDYNEFDLGVEWAFTPNININLVDYYAYGNFPGNKDKFTDFNKETSRHVVDLILQTGNFKKLPITLSWSLFLFEMDWDSDLSTNYNSSYIEATYTKGFEHYSLEAFLGFTPYKGFYADKAALVNSGLNLVYNKQTNHWGNMSLKIGVVYNPYIDKMLMPLGFIIQI